MLSKQLDELLPLAEKIARDFGNIPGLPHAEIVMTAQEALARALPQHRSEKGELRAYVVQAMKNALRDLYERQMRHHQHHEYGVDFLDHGSVGEAPSNPATPIDESPRIEYQVAARESAEKLALAMNALSPKLRFVAEGVRDGKNYREIGESMGISKQAAHKLAGAALTSLREQLDQLGYRGVDTMGFLKSQVDDFSAQP
jgi:RNA polymerase sigma factor (sigma-70 family)